MLVDPYVERFVQFNWMTLLPIALVVLLVIRIARRQGVPRDQCRTCGARNPQVARFCRQCGGRLRDR
jgi:ribosomal protein L40E